MQQVAASWRSGGDGVWCYMKAKGCAETLGVAPAHARQGRRKVSGTDKSEGRLPAHPSALSPVLDGCVQKLIHKIHQLGEHS